MEIISYSWERQHNYLHIEWSIQWMSRHTSQTLLFLTEKICLNLWNSFNLEVWSEEYRGASSWEGEGPRPWRYLPFSSSVNNSKSSETQMTQTDLANYELWALSSQVHARIDHQLRRQPLKFPSQPSGLHIWVFSSHITASGGPWRTRPYCQPWEQSLNLQCPRRAGAVDSHCLVLLQQRQNSPVSTVGMMDGEGAFLFCHSDK